MNRSVVSTQKSLLKKLNSVMQSVLGQLQRVKGLHQKMVPVRNESIRGVNISSRFCAGTSSGGLVDGASGSAPAHRVKAATALSGNCKHN